MVQYSIPRQLGLLGKPQETAFYAVHLCGLIETSMPFIDQ